jgi:hypothetical protein
MNSEVWEQPVFNREYAAYVLLIIYHNCLLPVIVVWFGFGQLEKAVWPIFAI